MKHFFMRFSWLQWFLLGACLLIFVGTVGLAFGYIAGAKDRENNLALSIAADTQVQYELGLKDFEAGNYALARQRFDYVLKQDPNYPGVVDILTETLMRLSEPIVQITEAPSFTLTPSPTPDTRQVDVLFAQAEEQFRKIIQINERFSPAYYNMGLLYMKQQPPDVITAFSKPNNPLTVNFNSFKR